ncbi:hypothetical protein D3C85_113080 [compost metagenome]
MESLFARLFLDLQEQIKTKVPDVVYIEQDLGQLGTEDPRKSLMFPAVLIDFPSTPFSNLQGDNQLGSPVISVTLVFDNWNQTYQLSPLEVRKAGLNYLEVEQKLYKTIQGWNADYCEKLNRTNANGHNRNDVGLRVRELIFTTQFEDYSCDDATPTMQLGLRTE